MDNLDTANLEWLHMDNLEHLNTEEIWNLNQSISKLHAVKVLIKMNLIELLNAVQMLI
jgi:hypothetical protein